MSRYSRIFLFLFPVVAGAALAQGDRLSPGQALAKLRVAEGLQVTTFASDPEIVSISNLDVDHRGRVWACECVNYRGNRGKRPAGDRILILEDTTGDGISDKTKVFYQGPDIDIAMGLCVLGSKVIVAVSPDILLLEDTDGDDKADKKTVLLTSDAEFQHDHSLHSFVFGPDGRFYGNFGNTGHRLKDAAGKVIIDRAGREVSGGGKPYHGGIVFRCDREFRNFEVLGHNFRNNYEATVDSFGRVWQSDNDDDGNLAVRLNYILEGGNYGYLEELTGQRWRVPRLTMHPFRGKAHWHQNDPGAVPNVIETGNGAPGGVTVYEGDLLPSQVHGQVLFCEAGGHVLWGLPVTRSGAGFTARKFDLLRSPDNNHRPIDVAVAPDGSVVVSDWYDPVIGGFRQNDIERGRIYRIAPEGHHFQSPGYDFDSPEGAAKALYSPNYCARYLAWMRLYELGSKAEAPLQAMLQEENPRLRARALWLLGQMPEKGDHYLGVALKDREAEVRIVGLRLADLRKKGTLEVTGKLLRDPSVRVRAECAAQLRHHQSGEAAKLWAVLAAQYDGKDRWYLEALGIGAEGKWDACFRELEGLGIKIGTGAWNDLVWRSRGTRTPDLLANIILAADAADDVARYIRAFDFQAGGEEKARALLRVALGENVSRKIALEALGRVPMEELQREGDHRPKLARMLSGGTVDASVIKLIRDLRLEEAYPRLLEMAQDEGNDRRVDAIGALLALRQQDLIVTALEGADAVKALATGRVLARAERPSSFALLWSFLAKGDLDGMARRETAREMCRSRVGALQVIKRLEAGLLGEEIKPAVASVLLLHLDGEVRKRARPHFPLAPSRDAQALPPLSELVARRGDADKGREIFARQGQCATCHRVAGKGTAIGPDLDSAGKKLARSALYESILYPSAAISHDYENYTARLGDRSVVGVLVSKSEKEIQLRDAQGTLQVLERKQVKSLDRLPVSLMPANLHQLLTTAELVDLVEYLGTLKE